MPKRVSNSITIALSPIIACGLKTVSQVAPAGRGRWKVENENNNVLKTKGYHIEHNFGHGKRYLAAFLLNLNLLAFLFHTVLQWCDEKYALLRQVLVRRQTFSMICVP